VSLRTASVIPLLMRFAGSPASYRRCGFLKYVPFTLLHPPWVRTHMVKSCVNTKDETWEPPLKEDGGKRYQIKHWIARPDPAFLCKGRDMGTAIERGWEKWYQKKHWIARPDPVFSSRFAGSPASYRRCGFLKYVPFTLLHPPWVRTHMVKSCVNTKDETWEPPLKEDGGKRYQIKHWIARPDPAFLCSA
jgi:hypothetical protein